MTHSILLEKLFHIRTIKKLSIVSVLNTVQEKSVGGLYASSALWLHISRITLLQLKRFLIDKNFN